MLRSNAALLSARALLYASRRQLVRITVSPSKRSIEYHTAQALRQPEVFHSQIQNQSSAGILSSFKTSSRPPQTLTEKIIQKYAVGLPEGKYVRSGDFVTLSPHHLMTHDNSLPVMLKFLATGATKIHNNKQIVMTLDHDVQNKSETNLKKYQRIEEFAKEHNVDFYPAGRGIGHQIIVEEGYAWPGTLVVASDSHSNTYGALSCLGTPVVRTDAAGIWACGSFWFQIPGIIKVTLRGVLPFGVTGKDVIVALAGLFNKDEFLNHIIEFTGSEETLQSLPIDDRLAISNMTTEAGALAGVFPTDKILERWLRGKASAAAIHESDNPSLSPSRFSHGAIDQLISNKLEADRGAKYAKELYLDLSTLSPYVSGPNSVTVATPLAELASQDISIDRAYLVSCTNSRASDLAAAAKVFKDAAEKNDGKIPKIADGVKLYIAAASLPEQKIAEAAGDWQALIEAGAQPLPSGCGPCIGLGTGLLQPGETGISASNRNFKGRMGSTEAKAYLASPEVVAASALSGKLSGPGKYEMPEGWTGVKYGLGDGIKEEERMLTAEEAMDKVISQLDSMIVSAEAEFGSDPEKADIDSDLEVEILPGFPERISGEIVFCDADSVSTDAVYPGKMTYNDYVTPEEMAEACMQNYDPEFSTIAKASDILVSGYNFGCGSSREQAATSILAKGIPLVIAASLGNIFSRNSINNGLMGLEVPKLVSRLREAFPAEHDSKSEGIVEPSLNKESLDSPSTAPMAKPQKVLTRRTGWTLTWNVKRSRIEVTEGPGGATWTEKVGDFPISVQEIMAKGGLEKWIQAQLKSS